ncbi:Leucyl-tRNA synthetase, partial [hydrothermal vent metagenome]
LDEPFAGLFTQGMVTHETYKDEAGDWLYPEEVGFGQGGATHAKTGEAVTIGPIESMSKSKKNIVDPSAIIALYGADTARWFILSDTPPERDIQWTESGVDAAARFVQRLWKFIQEGLEAVCVPGKARPRAMSEAAVAIRKAAHKALHNVTEALETLRFNRAIAHVYEMTNDLGPLFADTQSATAPDIRWARREALEIYVRIFAPMMPHLAEQAWADLGHRTLVVKEPWPKVSKPLLVEDTVIIAIQVNGKRKGQIEVPRGLSREEIESRALNEDNVGRAISGREVRKVIVVPERIVNVVL